MKLFVFSTSFLKTFSQNNKTTNTQTGTKNDSIILISKKNKKFKKKLKIRQFSLHSKMTLLQTKRAIARDLHSAGLITGANDIQLYRKTTSCVDLISLFD